MKRAISQMLIENTHDNKTYHCSIIEKQSDLGLAWNSRLLILIENVEFGYISKYKETDNPANIDLEKMKERIPIKNLVKVDQEKKTLKIFFWKQENTKKVKKNWAIRFSHEDLTNKWRDLFSRQKSASIIKRGMSPHSSVNHSPSKSELMKKPDLEHHRINKTDSQMNSYNNPLYESQKQKKEQSLHNHVSRKLDYNKQPTFIIQQDPGEEKVSDFNQTKNNRDKMEEYNNLKELERRKQEDRKRKQQEQQRERQKQREKQRERELEKEREQIRKEKQKLERERLEMQRQKKAFEEQKLKKEKQENQRKNEDQKHHSNKQITVLNQKYFKIDEKNNPKSDNRKPEPSKKVDLPKPKPKVDNNFNYYDIVNKLVSQNQLQRNKDSQQEEPLLEKFDEAHDYIFELEKQKLSKLNEQKRNLPKKSQEKENLKLGWTFKYLVKEAINREYEVIEQFGAHCESILKQLVDEFCLPEFQKHYVPKYKCEQFYAYEKEDVEFKVAMIGLKQIYSSERKGERDKICDASNVKLLETQFKNFEILYQATKNQNMIRVPLVCISQYRGFVAFFKTNSYFDQKATPRLPNEPKLSAALENISEKTRISLDTFNAKGNMLILKLDQKIYRELALATDATTLTRFDYYYIQEIKYLMPPDFLYEKKYNDQKDQSYIPRSLNLVLRKELLFQYLQSEEKISNIVYSTLQKDMRAGKPNVKSLKQSRIQLEQTSQNILSPITDFIKELDDLSFYYITSNDLSSHLHSQGINLRYLGLIYEHSYLMFNKSCILSEIAARTCKILLRKTIQDLYFEQLSQESSLNKQSYDKCVMYKLMDFFNCILGNSAETVAIWNVLSVHSLSYYQVKLQYDYVNKGMFLIALAHHCGLVLDWTQIDVNSIFQRAQFFTEDNFYGTKQRTKVYEPMFSEKQEEILEMVKQQNAEYFNQLVKMYDLSMNPIPSKVCKSQYSSYVRKYLASFIPPNTNGSFKHLNLYEYSGVPSREELEIKFMELKWHLRNKKKQKYIKQFTGILTHISMYFGDFHPLLSDLYDIFSLYHQNNGEFEDSITFAKSSVVNILKICGANHFKTAESYFQLAQCCIKAGKKEQAVINLQKAKKIFETCEKIDTTSYSLVTLKLGLLFLSENKVKQAEEIVKYSLDILSRSEKFSKKKFEDEKVEGFEILFRCYELQDLKDEIENLGRQTQIQLKYIEHSHNFEKLMKIAIYPRLRRQTPQLCSCYIDIINMLEIQPSSEKYIASFQRLNDRVMEDSFFENMENYIENITTIEKYLIENGTLKKWKTFAQVYERETINDFVSFTQEILYFLGEGFVSGILRENL